MMMPSLIVRDFIVSFFSSSDKLLAEKNVSAVSGDIAVVVAEKELPIKISQNYSRASVRPI